MPSTHTSGDNRGGSHLVWTIDPAANFLQREVARVLPKAAKHSSRTTATHICPKCMGYKHRKAKVCRDCWSTARRGAREAARRRAMARADGIKEPPRFDRSVISGHRVHWRHPGEGGGLRPQPVRERLVMGDDRVWRTVADHEAHIKALALNALNTLVFEELFNEGVETLESLE